MLDVPKYADQVRIAFFNDDDTPWQFVVDLLRSVFGKSEADAALFASTVDKQGQAMCGPYPPDVADALLKAARRRIEEHGHPLSRRLGRAKRRPNTAEIATCVGSAPGLRRG